MRYEKKFDLHCHSTCSDGSLTPKELIDLAIKKGLSGISITDHDTLDAYTLENKSYAQSMGIELIDGVEISTNYQGVSVHILAYGVGHEVVSLIDKIHCQRENRNRQIIEHLNDQGLAISLDDIRVNRKKGSLGRPHMAEYLVKKGFVKDFREAFTCYLNDEKIAHIKGWALDTKECIEEIKRSGARTVLAHPHLLSTKKRVEQLLDLGVDAMECYYANFSLGSIQHYLEMAKYRNILVTGGSDFHGKFKPQLELGASFTNDDDFQNLKA